MTEQDIVNRQSDHLKHALNIKIKNDKQGNPVLVNKNKLVLLGVKLRGAKEWSLKKA